MWWYCSVPPGAQKARARELQGHGELNIPNSKSSWAVEGDILSCKQCGEGDGTWDDHKTYGRNWLDSLRWANLILPESEADFVECGKKESRVNVGTWFNGELNCLLICLLVDPEYQKEAEQRHRELAAKAGGFNDFATLAVIFEQCKSRYVSWSFHTGKCHSDLQLHYILTVYDLRH